ncbi:MAG TPA: 4-hydroxy-tetrahydrodipicolinate reductase [Bacteroidota bacterium]|nr:4-hydroxy-tetrahydrodipicolinate reductase [Bacteroidota bacterium]
MNIALIGYGKMGKEVESAAKGKGLTVAKVFDVQNNTGSLGLTAESLKGVDVCIEFSTPGVVLDNIAAVAACGKNIVVGTTGWYDRLDAVRKLVKEHRIGFLYSPNFSLGVNIFTQIVAHASHLMDRYTQYDAAVLERHHRAKVDSPSGTALTIASTVLQGMKRKTEILAESPRGGIKPNQLHVSSTRLGSVTGTHAVVFDSDADSIELVHAAKNRSGFALGAVVAAEWLRGKKGFYTMRDVITL